MACEKDGRHKSAYHLFATSPRWVRQKGFVLRRSAQLGHWAATCHRQVALNCSNPSRHIKSRALTGAALGSLSKKSFKTPQSML